MNTDNVLKLDAADLKDRFYYCETSSTGLRFNKDLVRGRGKGYVYKKKGEEAGTPMFMRGKEKHMTRVQINDGRLAPVHRIIWTIVFGEIEDGHVIDHIDGDPFNNNIANLRSIPSGENARNAKKRKDNKTGVTGVVFYKGSPPKSYGTYIALWKEDGKSRSRTFSIKKYGEELAFLCACEMRDKMVRILNMNGAGYTERHGVESEEKAQDNYHCIR